MKDLDFDELDKAVNSLMTNVPKGANPPKADDTEKTLDITPTIDENATPSFDTLSSATAQVTGAPVPPLPASAEPVSPSPITPSVSPPPAARRGGRFMDVVHASSDMKKSSMPERPVSRSGVSIGRDTTTTPPEVKPLATPDTSAPLVFSDDLPTASSQPALKTPESAAPTTNEWPDPLDVAQPPLTSPFLPDTKVEKRPLGNGMPTPSEMPSVSDADVSTDKTAGDANAQLPAQPPEVDTPLPEELQGDLMAIEADTHMGMPKTEEMKPAETPVAPTPPLLEKEEAPRLEAVATPEAPVGPTSIPQQYREEESTGDQDNGAIYDTDTYHQPLTHPAKKKPSWLWVVWIVLILLVGAAGGAALYFFVI